MADDLIITGEDGQDDNGARVRRAAVVVDMYGALAGLGGLGEGEELETIITDLVVDLRHLARAENVDWDYVERVSEMHFQAEDA